MLSSTISATFVNTLPALPASTTVHSISTYVLARFFPSNPFNDVELVAVVV